MPIDRTSRLLDEFSAVTDAAPRPDSRRITMRSRFPVATLSAASLVVVIVAVAAIVLGRSTPGPVVGSSPAPSAAAAASAPASSHAAVASVASVEPTVSPCRVADLSARITLWEGAAGQRIAHVQLTNTGAAACMVDDVARPQLVGGDDAILIDGPAAAPAKQLVVAPGGTLDTLVAAGNYCKAAPQPPVSVAFVFADGQRLIADPASPTDATLPPCNGASVPATISMHAWAR